MKIATFGLGAAGLVLAAGLGVVSVVHGGPGGAGPHGHGGGAGAEGPMAIPHMVEWLVDNALDGVNATDAQRTKVQAVKDRVLSQAATLHQAHDSTHEEFARQWQMDKMDAAQLHALVDARIEDLRRVLHTAVDGVVDVHDTLTPAQRQTLMEKVKVAHGAK